MNRIRQSLICLAALALAMATPAQTVAPMPVKFSPASTNLLPPFPPVQSPVTFFRQLLLMSPGERNHALAGRTPEARARVMAKIREYQVLGPDERELRLRATELRWYLMPLLHAAPADREPLLGQVPPEFLELVKSRLAQWDLLPPQLQQEFLSNERTLHYFAQTPGPSATNAVPDKIAEQFNRFMDLTPAEKQHLLGTLSGPERSRMEETLKTFDALPARQRVQCVRNYAKFAGMSATERTEFLKNAEKWAQMSPQERQTWRDLVAHVPLWPPVPSAMPPMPPLPPTGLPKHVHAGMATN